MRSPSSSSRLYILCPNVTLVFCNTLQLPMTRSPVRDTTYNSVIYHLSRGSSESQVPSRFPVMGVTLNLETPGRHGTKNMLYSSGHFCNHCPYLYSMLSHHMRQPAEPPFTGPSPWASQTVTETFHLLSLMSRNHTAIRQHSVAHISGRTTSSFRMNQRWRPTP